MEDLDKDMALITSTAIVAPPNLNEQYVYYIVFPCGGGRRYCEY